MRKSSLSVVLSLLAVLFPAGAAHAQNMAVSGQFAVASNGAATYTIPITVPPGVAGMQPQLALSYSSQAGNGLVGVGWGVSGLSAITRCPRTMAQDGARGGVNYDANDRFCLDGQRLILVTGNYGEAGSEYRTEVEGFSRITYDGLGFVVQSKAGLTSEYGKTEDSRIEAQGKSAVRMWALSRISDVVNNCMAYSYEEDNTNGDFRLRFIDYAGTVSGTGCVGGNNRVEFSYQDRTDVVSKYRGGSVLRTLQRLSSIKTVTSGQEVRQYRLRYMPMPSPLDRSKLAGVQECAFVSACHKEMVMTYKTSSSDRLKLDSEKSSQLMRSSYEYINNFDIDDVFRFVDINGDGLPDRINFYPVLNTEPRRPIDPPPGIYINVDGDFVYDSEYTKSTPLYLFSAFQDKENSGRRFVDINGDGLLDLVDLSGNVEGQNEKRPQQPVRRVYLNNGSKFILNILYSETLNNSFFPDKDRTVLTDINGDGLLDLVNIFPAASFRGRKEERSIYLNNGSGFYYDSIYSASLPDTYVSGDTSLIQSLRTSDMGTRFIDINGDGLIDIVQLFMSSQIWYGGVPQRRVYLNNGNSFVFDLPYSDGLSDIFFSGVDLSNQANPNAEAIDMGTRFVDLNDDDLPDLIQLFFPKNDWYEGVPQQRVYINNGNGFVSSSEYVKNLKDLYFSGYAKYQWDSSFQKFNSIDLGVRVTDINGDGFLDLIQMFLPKYNFYNKIPQQRVFLNNGVNFFLEPNYSDFLSGNIYFTGEDALGARRLGLRLDDLNGDSLPDLIQVFKSQKHSAWFNGVTQASVRLSNVLVSDGLLASVDDGTGNIVTINYLDKHVYEKSPAVTAYPLLRVPGPLNLVTEHSKTDGAGGMSKFSYSFRNLGVELGTGRGWQGFKSMTVKEEATGIERYTEYRQGWPFTGMAELAETRLAGAGSAGVLKRTQTTYACQTGAGAACQAVPINCNLASNVVACNAISRGRVMPFAAKVSEQGWDLNGAALPSSTTDTTYNEWGDVSTMVVQTSAGGGTSSKRVNNEYHPVNTGNGKWIVGRLKKATVTSTVTTP